MNKTKVQQLAFLLLLAFFFYVITPNNIFSASTAIFLGILIGAFSQQGFKVLTKHYLRKKTKTIYVGNLPYRANEKSIINLFSKYGRVVSINLVKDKNTGKRKGFGFVTMLQKDAENAIINLHNTEYQNRYLKVREAIERNNNSSN